MLFTTIRPVVAVLTIATALLSSCGGGSEAGAPRTDSSVAVAASDTNFNDADVVFAQGMIPHHAQAVEMASMALDPGSMASAEVQALAMRIRDAQDPEIELMTGWLQTWGEPIQMPGMEGMDGMDGMEGMMSEEQMASLADLSGPDFDTAWSTLMIAHHEGAIAQAETAKAAGSDPAVLALADQIISAQRTEITEMQALVAS